MSLKRWLLLSGFLLIGIFCLVLPVHGLAAEQADRVDPVNYNGIIDASPERQLFLLNKDWQYLEQSLLNVTDSRGEDLNWQIIDLPHTWNNLDVTDHNPGYRRDESWYAKDLFIPDSPDQHIWKLIFEGVNISSDVYVNGHKAGGHIGGYVGYRIDLTPHLIPGEINRLLVRVDNRIDRSIIPSQKSDFFIYGGITRDVWLEVVSPLYIDAIRVSTPEVSKNRALTRAVVNIMNALNDPQEVSLEVSLYDASRKKVLSKTVKTQVTPGISIQTVDLPALDQPRLWSPEHPNLYSLEILLQNDKTRDRVNEKFGFRWFEFKKNGPFYLNGERVLLRGTHRHEEYAGYGNAMPNSLHRRDMEMIKEMGANFVRLAHYPQDPEVYRACDELGLLVWDELPWCRGGVGDDVWKAHTLRLLKEQILQNFNHPSIILWSLGNEMYWEADYPNGGDIDSLRTFLGRLNSLAHQLDPGRKTAIRKFYDAVDLVDVFSPSIWAGWYSGVYKTYEQALIKSRDKYPYFFHAEYGGASHVGRHTENPITGEGFIKEDEWAEKPNMIGISRISSAGDWSENYLVDLFDWHLRVSEGLDWFAGNAQWAFKDFGTPLRPENPIPWINQKGLVDRAGNPKDAYYVFKSYWTKDPKFCYIESHTWTERTGSDGEIKQICVYSNCQEVELILNGKSLGRKAKDPAAFPANGLNWDTAFTPGSNDLKAFGYHQGAVVTIDSLAFTYYTRQNKKPQEIQLHSEKMTNGNFLVVAIMADEDGRRCLDYNKRIYFDHNGSGQLKKFMGTPTGSDIIEFANGRAAIEFVPGKSGRAVIEARNQDFKGGYITIDCP